MTLSVTGMKNCAISLRSPQCKAGEKYKDRILRCQKIQDKIIAKHNAQTLGVSEGESSEGFSEDEEDDDDEANFIDSVEATNDVFSEAPSTGPVASSCCFIHNALTFIALF